MKYAFFFAPKWGFSLGLGVSRYAAKATLNTKGHLPDLVDNGFLPNAPGNPTGHEEPYMYDARYEAKDLVERQQIFALEVPLQFHFEHKVNKNTGIFASLGATGYFPVLLAQSKFSKGSVITSGYSPYTDCTYTYMRHFGKEEANTVSPDPKMRMSVDAVAEFGGIFRISEICDFYLGAYGSYGFFDLLPKEKANFLVAGADSYTVNSVLASDYLQQYNEMYNDGKAVSEKWNRWQIGAKVGFHIKPLGKKARQEKRLRDAQKEFYEDASDYMKKGGKSEEGSREPQIVYIYNVAPQGYLEDKGFTQPEKDNITSLVDALGKGGKILFDLDSDVPKIDDRQFIYDASEILKKDQSLSVIIEGYTCDLGTAAHNRDLAKRRANAIRDLFIKQGVSPSQITTDGYIASDPQNKYNIQNDQREEHRAVIFRIVKR